MTVVWVYVQRVIRRWGRSDRNSPIGVELPIGKNYDGHLVNVRIPLSVVNDLAPTPPIPNLGVSG